MTICVFIRELNIGGAEKQSMYLCKILMEKHKTYLVVLNDHIVEKRYLKYIEKEGIEIIFLSGNMIQKIIKFILILRRNQIDIIFSYLFSNNVISALAGKISGVPNIIGGIRNCIIVRRKLLITRLLHNHILSYSIFNSYSGLKNLTAQGFSGRKSTVIPNCIEIQKKSSFKNPVNDISILTVARFLPQKDYITSLDSIYYLKNKLLNNKPIQIKYIIVGYGKDEMSLRKYISKQHMDDYVSIIIRPDNIEKYYEQASIYLSTSLYEGLSNSIMEAMSFSLPIIATNVGDNNRLVENAVNGYLIPVGDAISGAKNMFELVVDSERRKKFAKVSYKKLAENYSLEKFKERYNEFIENLTA